MRKLILGLALLLTLGTVAGQPVNITDSSGLDFELAGGEERGFWVEFETGEGFSNSDVLEARLTVRNDNLDVAEGEPRVTGEGFDLSSDSELVNTCESDEGGVNYSVHTCRFNESEVFEADDRNVSFNLKSDPRLMPADYGFEFDLLSNTSEVVDSEEVEIDDGSGNVSLDAGGSDVDLNISASEDTSAEVEAYSSMPVEEPDETPVMVSAVSVETEDDSARGNITFEHPPGLVDVEVYYLDGGRWSTEGVEVVERADSYVKAEVPHFSTYAAYGIDPDYDDTQEQPEISESAVSPVASPSGTDASEAVGDGRGPEEDTSGPETDGQQDDPRQDTGQENQTVTDQEETGGSQEQETSDEPATDTPTGLFTAEPSNIAGIAVFLVAVVAALLQYTGRIEFRNIHQKTRG